MTHDRQLTEKMTEDATKRTPRQQIRDWWNERFNAQTPIDLTTDAAKAALTLRQDKAFCDAFLDAFLHPVIYEIGLNLITQKRGTIRRASRTMSADDIVSHMEAERPEWSTWMEHEPATGKHIALLTMTKEQLLAAAQQRESRTAEDNHRAGLLRLIAGRLKPGQVAGAVWTEDELTVIDQRLSVKLKTVLRPMDDLTKGAAA